MDRCLDILCRQMLSVDNDGHHLAERRIQHHEHLIFEMRKSLMQSSLSGGNITSALAQQLHSPLCQTHLT
jgi:hypothetical protein